ncbi:MAG: ICC-like phosphoesterase [Bacteroidota bacterium]|jgi:DNA ligase-associated metallophosphoesterase|nr:ICC-like phosphoesterase [Bacteroidota bacterium]
MMYEEQETQMQIKLLNTVVELLPEKALFLPDTNTLVIADIHFGKAMHFRKNGISIPPQSAERDYLRLNALIEKKQPARIIVLGDLFHSTHNSEWNLFCEFVAYRSGIRFMLVIGNHDILDRSYYRKLCLEVVENSLEIKDLILSHEPLKKVPEGMVNVAGHIHPGFTLQGRGRQNIKLPCFYMLPNQLILPAFGSLTGLYLLDRTMDSDIYVVTNDKVIEV